MAVLANQHERLVDDSILNPHLYVPAELYQVANVKFDIAPPKSLDVRVATQREQERLKDQLEQQRPTVTKILKELNLKWPLCSTCGGELLATKYELAKNESWGYANFRCPKHPEQWRDVAFPARPMAEMMVGIKGPSPLRSAVDLLPPNPSHGLATPGLTDQHKGGETK